jgi:hypothetical protein
LQPLMREAWRALDQPVGCHAFLLDQQARSVSRKWHCRAAQACRQRRMAERHNQ